MTVVGEQHIAINTQRGLYITNTPDLLPDGYCQSIINLFRTVKGTWETRKGFTFLGAVKVQTTDVQASFNPTTQSIPDNPHLSIYYTELQGGFQAPHIILSYIDNAGLNKIQHWTGRITAGNVESATQGLASVIAQPTTFSQFRNKIYCAAGWLIYNIPEAGFLYTSATPAGTLAPALIATLPGTNAFTTADSRPILVNYFNRTFHCYGSRVTYTDVALTAAWADVWNAGANFFDLPTTNLGNCNIYDAIQLNGVLYFFTDKGVFALNGEDTTDTWSVRFITDAIKIYSRGAVALINGTFIATDKKKLMVFNGVQPKEFGTEIGYVFNVFNSFSIQPFLKGFILTCRYFAVSGITWIIAAPPAGTNSWEYGQSRNLYFDGTVWVDISFGTSITVPDQKHVLFGSANKQKNLYTRDGNSYLAVYDQAGTQYHMVYYDYLNNGDSNYDHATKTFNIVRLKTKDIEEALWMRYTRIKRAAIRVFSLITTVTINRYKQGSTIADALPDTIALTSVSDNNYLLNAKGINFNSRGSYEIILSGTLTDRGDFTAGPLPFAVPLAEIKSISLVVEADARDSTPQIGS